MPLNSPDNTRACWPHSLNLQIRKWQIRKLPQALNYTQSARARRIPHRAEAREPGRLAPLAVNVVRVLAREVREADPRETRIPRILRILLRLVQAAGAIVLGSLGVGGRRGGEGRRLGHAAGGGDGG